MDELTRTETDLYTGRTRTITVRVGDRVRVRQSRSDRAWGTVDGIYEDVKNGEPGIDWTTDSGAHHWAYLDQVEYAERG